MHAGDEQRHFTRRRDDPPCSISKAYGTAQGSSIVDIATVMTATSPNPADRFVSVTYYFGLAPLAKFWSSPSSNPFLRHHYDQAMAAFAFFLMFFLAACLYDTGECFFIIQFPDFARQLIEQWGSFLAYLDYASWLLIVAFVALWITLIGLAVAGSTWQVPLLKRLMRRPGVIRLSLVANSFVLSSVPLITVLALHATSLTRRSGEGAAVYFLYDEGISVPRWGFALGLYRSLCRPNRTGEKDARFWIV